MTGTKWIKASKSFAHGNCLELAAMPDGAIGVRDSKDKEGPVLRLTRAELAAFLDGAKAGEFDHLA